MDAQARKAGDGGVPVDAEVGAEDDQRARDGAEGGRVAVEGAVARATPGKVGRKAANKPVAAAEAVVEAEGAVDAAAAAVRAAVAGAVAAEGAVVVADVEVAGPVKVNPCGATGGVATGVADGRAV